MALGTGIAIVGVWMGVALTAFALRNNSDSGMVLFFGFVAAAIATIAIVVNK